MDTNQHDLLEYVPFSSLINASFWHKFTEIKLDVDRLNQSARKICGFYSILSSEASHAIFEVDSTSFNLECTVQNTYLPIYGVIVNKNTIEQFKDCNKQDLLQTESQCLWELITSDAVLENPALLNYFLILSFADLKKYFYYYWFCFPTLSKINTKIQNINTIARVHEDAFVEKIEADFQALTSNNKTFFIVSIATEEVHHLSAIKSVISSNTDEYYFAFSDPSSSPQYPGWPLRNFIIFILHQCPYLKGLPIKVLAVRLQQDKLPRIANSLIFTVLLPEVEVEQLSCEGAWIGWEKNERGKFGPRLANMKNSMDPKCLAESAVDLNLKLMKWQLLPDIDLEKIKAIRCLLLGSGTLGCSVARTLLGWGVRHITFVDNATVSFSNPVRQSLFVYDDCVKNKPKAEAAADCLKKIFPGVNATGFCLNIPMPGHPIGDSLLNQTKESVESLITLISDHDIIFLLMDSRESRWLPTMLGSYYKKIVVNAALGFDTYLVMRHGSKTDAPNDIDNTQKRSLEGLKSILGTELGCYFCNDVTAPGNSLKDRTLDQQCTVTRPGISAIAGALAVELAVSILQHPHGINAPAFYRVGSREMGVDIPSDCNLGIIPHSIRGFLSTYSTVLPATQKYKQCVACSESVLAEYDKNGFDFLLNVFDSSNYLEKVTGLAELQQNISDLEVWDLDDEDESDD